MGKDCWTQKSPNPLLNCENPSPFNLLELNLAASIVESRHAPSIDYHQLVSHIKVGNDNITKPISRG